MIQKSYKKENFVNCLFIYINNARSKKTSQITLYKYLYSKFFFEKNFGKKLSNSSLTSFFSFSNRLSYYDKQFYNLILFDKSFFYWNNVSFVREYTDLSSVNSNFITYDYTSYLYVFIWFCAYYFMELLL